MLFHFIGVRIYICKKSNKNNTRQSKKMNDADFLTNY